MSQRILYFIFIFFYINLSISAGNTVGNQLHQTNIKAFETRHLSGFESSNLGKKIEKYDVFYLKSKDIISYLQDEKFNNNLFVDFLHLGTWQLNLYVNDVSPTQNASAKTDFAISDVDSYLSYQGLTCGSVGEIHFNIAPNFIEAYVDNGKMTYFIEPLQRFTNNKQHQNLYVVYELKNVLNSKKKNDIQDFLQASRNLEQKENAENVCDISLAYQKNIYCRNAKNIFPILKHTENGGHFSAFPIGLNLNHATGEIAIGKSKADMYIISYKKNNCTTNFVLDILDLPNASFELPKTHFRYKDSPISLRGNTRQGFFSGLGVKDGIFYPHLVPKSLRNQPVKITHTVSNRYCEDSETQMVFFGHLLLAAKQEKIKNVKKQYILQTSIVLEDAYIADKETMRTDLLEQEILPLSQPYYIAPWNYQGLEKEKSYAHFPKNTVDWVLLELRDAQKVNCVIAQKAALLLADGSIVNVEKNSGGVIFEDINSSKEYYVVVRHRNHIDIISTNAICMSKAKNYSSNKPFKIVYAQAYQKHITPIQSELFSGDADGNNVVSVRDFEYFQEEYGKKKTYSFFDFNLDGQVNEIDFECYIKNATEIGMKEIRY